MIGSHEGFRQLADSLGRPWQEACHREGPKAASLRWDVFLMSFDEQVR